MNLSIELKQVWELLSYSGSWSSVSLVNHKWLAELIKCQAILDSSIDRTPDDVLREAGFYLDLSEPMHPILYSLHGWIEECKRVKLIEDISKNHVFNPSALPITILNDRQQRLKAIMLSQGYTEEDALKIVKEIK